MKNLIRLTLAIIATIIGMNGGFAQNDSLVVRVRDIDIVMMKVEGGTYQRGCTYVEDCKGCCLKQLRGENTVTVGTFYMAKLEVTQELYLAVMGKNPSWFKPDSAHPRLWKRPVESISWYNAQAFIDSLNALTGLHFRLPTEAEWEYAARGGKHDDPYVFSGSNENGYSVCMVNKAADISSLGKEMNIRLNGKGGGKPGFFQGSVRASRQEIEAFFRK